MSRPVLVCALLTALALGVATLWVPMHCPVLAAIRQAQHRQGFTAAEWSATEWRPLWDRSDRRINEELAFGVELNWKYLLTQCALVLLVGTATTLAVALRERRGRAARP